MKSPRAPLRRNPTMIAVLCLSVMMMVFGLLVLGSSVFGYSTAVPLLGQILMTPLLITAICLSATRKMDHDRQTATSTDSSPSHRDAPEG